jgi:hypothetical protein
MRLFRLLVSAGRRSGVGGLAECEHLGLDDWARKVISKGGDSDPPLAARTVGSWSCFLPAWSSPTARSEFGVALDQPVWAWLGCGCHVGLTF